MIEGILTNWAADLILGYGRLVRDYHWGDEQARAIKDAYNKAFEEVARKCINPTNHDVMRPKLEKLLNNDVTRANLIDIALYENEPDLDALKNAFTEAGLGRQYRRIIEVFMESLRDHLRFYAEDGVLHEIVNLAKLDRIEAYLVEIRDDVKVIKDDVKQVKDIVSSLEGVSSKSTPICPTPPATDVFGGRDAEIETISAQLTAGETAAIAAAVQGLGGIGKTALAKQLAKRLFDDRVFGAVLWTEVNRTPDAIALLQSWARACGITYTTTEVDPKIVAQDVRAKVTRAINDECADCERVLVVLDDVWDDGIEVAKLLKAHVPHNSTVLITTRSERVVSRLGASMNKLDKFTIPDGVKVLRLRLPEVDEAILENIVRALHGHALALKLAAQRALDEPERIRKHAQQYTTGIPEGESFKTLELEQGEGEDNLGLVLSYSYDELSEENARRFRYLGVLLPDTPFDEGILIGLWGIADDDERYAVIKRLRQLAVIERDETLSTDDHSWYTQHPLLRAYARALLKQKGEISAATDAYTDAIIGISNIFYEWRKTPEKWGVLTPYFPHVNAVGDDLIRRYEAGDTAQAERVIDFLSRGYQYLHHRREHAVQRGETWFRVGIKAAQAEGDEQIESLFTDALARLLNNLGRSREALPLYESALSLDRKLKVRKNEAATLNNIGMLYRVLGQNEKALNYYEQALPIMREMGDRGGEGTTLNNIGMVYDALGQHEKALDYYEQALPIMREMGDRGGEATTLSNMASIYFSQADLRGAADTFRQIIKVFEAIGDVASKAVIHANLAATLEKMGDLEGAIEEIERAVTLMRERGLSHGASGVTVEQYEAILVQWKRQRDGLPPLPQTIPQDQIDILVNNTVAVMTFATDKRDEWKQVLQNVFQQATQNQADDDAAFFTALLAVLDNQPASLPDDNPYQPHLARVLEAIKNHE